VTVLPESEVRASLGDLRRVNRWLGGRRGILPAARPHLRPGGRLLDVGCGSADIPAFVKSRVPAPVLAVGVDVKLLHVREAAPEVRVVVADARSLPFSERTFDVVTASHFLHHFDGEDLLAVVRGLLRLARGVLVVSDLHRAAVPLLFGRAFFPLLFRSRVSVADGLVSIRRGFRPAELRAVLEEAGATSVSLRRVFPYRLLAVAEAASGSARRGSP
jgi:ubiquinone/menaquinone biosynthesis C-methylase UbiE